MFLPPKLTAILGLLITLTIQVGSADGQQADFERRMAAMQEARARAQMPATGSVRLASSDVGVDYTDPPAPPQARVARRARSPQTKTAPKRVVLGQSSSLPPAVQQSRPQRTNAVAPVRRVAKAPNASYAPPQTRTAQLSAHSIVEGGSPIMGSQMLGSQMVGSPVIGSSAISSSVAGCSSCSSGGSIGSSYVGGEIISGGCSSCDSCGGGETYFEQDACCERGGCPPGPCWLSGLGGALYNGEYFGGATSFRSTLFSTPGGADGELSNDCSHGFYGGFNLGLPLCQLTGGVFSGQVGVRSVQTNFNGNDFTTDSRDQLFITAGFYRRVDYGFQAGVVADILHEEWFSENDIVQIRGDLGWVFGGGSTWGFRFATNMQDDITSGSFNGNNYTDLIHSTDDNYRVYMRQERAGSGFGEIFVGWSELDQTIIGLELDAAITENVAVQAGFTYYLNDDGLPAGTTNIVGGNAGEAYNIYAGFVYRPRGRSYYNSYDRPMFSVADNGSMLLTRTNQ